MDTPPSAPSAPSAASASLALPDHRWLPTEALVPGMVVARPVVAYTGEIETMYVAPGSPVTAQTISLMVVKGVECVAVRLDSEAASQAAAVMPAADFEARLDEIFGVDPQGECLALKLAMRQSWGTS